MCFLSSGIGVSLTYVVVDIGFLKLSLFGKIFPSKIDKFCKLANLSMFIVQQYTKDISDTWECFSVK